MRPLIIATVTGVLAISGCDILGMGRPAMREVMLFVQPEPTMAKVQYAPAVPPAAPQWVAGQSGEVDFKLSAYLKDIPAYHVRLTAYQAEYFNASGVQLPELAIARTSFTPPIEAQATGVPATNAEARFRLTLLSPGIQDFGAKELQRQPERDYVAINARLTLFGERLDRPAPLELSVNLPIWFGYTGGSALPTP